MRLMAFERDYFIGSKDSNYEDYRSRKFDALVEDLIESLCLDRSARILDFGCATGALVASLKTRGFDNLKGTDISYWAIEYGRNTYDLADELEYYNKSLLTGEFDIILMLDVLEHVPSLSDIRRYLSLVRRGTKLVVRVPVSVREGDPYYLEVSRNDVTHVQCHTSDWWHSLLEEEGYSPAKTLSGPAIYESDGVFARVYVKE